MSKSNTLVVDVLSLGFSIVILSLVALWTIQGDFITQMVDQSMTWQLIRSSGMSAYILFTMSTVWGLALSSKIVKDWSPGTLSMLLHATVSWMGVVFTIIHMGLLLFDEYVTYQIHQVLLPFMHDYRPVAVGLGILSFWIMLIVAVSFQFKKYLGHKNWKLLHYLSYLSFFMITAHAVFAGSDADKLGFQILLGLAVVGVVTLTGYRMGAGKKPPARKRVTAL